MTHDGFGGTWQKSNLSARLIGVVGPTHESHSYLGIGSWYGQSSGVEIHFLGGTLWEESAFGNAFALDWRGWNFRAETLWIGQINTRGESGFQSSASAEYSFASVWTVDFEYLNIESRFLDDRKVSRYSPLIGHNYLFGIISRQLWETIKVSMGSLYSLTDESLLGILKVRYSFSDHGETQFEVKSPFGKTESEFSNKRVLLPDGSYAGFPLFVSLNTKFVF